MKTAKNPVDGSILNSTQETGYLSPANEKAVAKEKPQFSTEINEPNQTLILEAGKKGKGKAQIDAFIMNSSEDKDY
tara:strand:+ start:454 stop:681 length:228 start_codon:yes stop_codon:yes gene_type:complete